MDGPTIRLMPGERRQQRVRIYGCDPGAKVMVQSATWELHDFYGEVVGQGSCVVSEGNLLTFMLAVDDPGRSGTIPPAANLLDRAGDLQDNCGGDRV